MYENLSILNPSYIGDFSDYSHISTWKAATSQLTNTLGAEEAALKELDDRLKRKKTEALWQSRLAEEIEHFGNQRKSITDYCVDLVKQWRGENTFKTPQGTEAERGTFFDILHPKLSVNSTVENPCLDKSLIVALGIEFAGRDPKFYESNLSEALGAWTNKTPLCYHYTHSGKDRTDDTDRWVKDNAYTGNSDDNANRFAKAILANLDPEKGFAYFSYSLGGISYPLLKNALAAQLQMQGKDSATVDYILSRTRSVHLGSMPMWGDKDALQQGKPKIATGPELSIISADDSFFQRVFPWQRGVCNLFSDPSFKDKPYIALSHPDDSNRVLIVLQPAIVPVTVGEKNTPNKGGHAWRHYLGALGLDKKGETVEALEPLHDAIAAIINHPEKFKDQSLAERLGAQKLYENKQDLEILEALGQRHLLAIDCLKEKIREEEARASTRR